MNFKKKLAESYRQIAAQSSNNPEQFIRAAEKLENEINDEPEPVHQTQQDQNEEVGNGDDKEGS